VEEKCHDFVAGGLRFCNGKSGSHAPLFRQLKGARMILHRMNPVQPMA